MPITLSIIIPAHNEADRLPAVLEDYVRYFDDRMGDAFELVIVANYCNDSTAETARRIAADHPQIRVIEEERRIGKGGAVIMGAKAARGEWIGFVDADGATAPAEFARLFDIAQKADGVIGSRWLPGAKVAILQKWMRQLSSRIFNLFIRLLLGLNYHDTQCGAKIFKKEAWHQILPNIGITRFAFDVDILFQLRREKFAIIEEPTEWHDVAGSKVNILASSLEMFLAIVRMRLLYSPLKPLVRLYERTIAKPVEFLLKDPLFRHTVLLSATAMVLNICNIGYQMIVSRALSAEEYALLATFLALFAIAARPLGTLGVTIVHFTSLLCKEGREGAVGRLITKWVLLSGGLSLSLMTACILFAKTIAEFFHLNRIEPVVISAIALPVMFVSPVLGGALRGLQRFGWVSVASSCAGIARVSLSAFFVLVIFPAFGWALAGHVGAMYISLLLISVALISIIKKYSPDNSKLPSLRIYIIQTFIIQICMSILVTGDVVLIKRYLPHEVDFAYAATLGRTVVFIVVAVISAMFPKVSSSGELTTEQRQVYHRAVMYTSVLMLVSVGGCSLFPAFLHRVLFNINQPSDHLIRLTRWISLIMAAAAMTNINISLLLAQRRFILASVTIPAALLYLGGVYLFHPSPFAVLSWAAASISIVLIVTTIGIRRIRKET